MKLWRMVEKKLKIRIAAPIFILSAPLGAAQCRNLKYRATQNRREQNKNKMKQIGSMHIWLLKRSRVKLGQQKTAYGWLTNTVCIGMAIHHAKSLI